MKKTYTGVGYGHTEQEAFENARSDAQDKANMDQLAGAAVAGAANVTASAATIFSTFVRGFFFAPLPSIIAAAILFLPAYLAYHLPSLFFNQDYILSGFFSTLIGVALAISVLAALFAAGFHSLTQVILTWEMALLRKSGRACGPLILLSTLAPTIFFILIVFTLDEPAIFFERVASLEIVHVGILLFVIVTQISSIFFRSRLYYELADYHWYGARRRRDRVAGD